MDNSLKVAEILLELNAVTLSPTKPYRYASGLLSPVYTDCRVIITYPKARAQIRDFYIEAIKESGAEFDVVAGTATAGIPHAAWIAEKLNLPMAYVRGKAKDHGKENMVEGIIKPGQKVLVIEDLVSTGDSSTNSVKAIEAAGGKVEFVFSIIKYGLKKSTDNFLNNNLKLVSLTDFETVVQKANKLNYLTESETQIVLDWIKDPENWASKHNFE